MSLLHHYRLSWLELIPCNINDCKASIGNVKLSINARGREHLTTISQGSKSSNQPTKLVHMSEDGIGYSSPITHTINVDAQHSTFVSSMYLLQ